MGLCDYALSLPAPRRALRAGKEAYSGLTALTGTNPAPPTGREADAVSDITQSAATSATSGTGLRSRSRERPFNGTAP